MELEEEGVSTTIKSTILAIRLEPLSMDKGKGNLAERANYMTRESVQWVEIVSI